jgi:hypothetical protein
MPYPTIYAVDYSYTDFQESQGDNSFPGTQLDADLAGLQETIASLDTFMQRVMRSDGALNNGIVTFDSLSPGLQLTVDPTNGNLVAAAVATTAAAAASAVTAETGAQTALAQVQTIIAGQTVSDFGTRALAAAATIPPATSYIRVAGNAVAGDGDDGLYTPVGSEPQHSSKILNGAQWWEATRKIITTTGVVVPASTTFVNLAMRQLNGNRNTATIGAGSQFDGFYIDLESSSGSNVTSNCYAAILHVTNSGPGTTKGIHAGAFAEAGSTGVLVAVNTEITPLATSAVGSALIQVSPVQSAGVCDGVVTGIDVVSSDINGVLNHQSGVGGLKYRYVVGCTLTTIPVDRAFMHWQVAPASSANARFLQLVDSSGNESQYVKKTGEVVSLAGLIAGSETNGITITQAAITRNIAGGTLVIAAGTSAQLILEAGGVTGLEINTDGTQTPGVIVGNGSVATAMSSVGPTGASATIQGWEKITIGGQARYRPFW